MSTPILSWMHPQHVSSRGIGFSSPDDMAERATNSPGQLAPRGVYPPTHGSSSSPAGKKTKWKKTVKHSTWA